MSTVYEKVEAVGTSTESLSDAVKNAVAGVEGAGEGCSWFEVLEQRCAVKEGKVFEFQVTVKVNRRKAAGA